MRRASSPRRADKNLNVEGNTKLRSRHSVDDGHIIIAGTGRAGTTLLVQLFTALGFNTGFTYDEAMEWIDPLSHAGLEGSISDDFKPYVVKSLAYPDTIAEAQNAGSIKIHAAIIPMRDLVAAAESRRRVYYEAVALRLDPFAQSGTLWQTLEPAWQEVALAMQFYRTVLPLVQCETPTYFPEFPRFAYDVEYLNRALAPLLSSHGVTLRELQEAHRAVAKPELIHTKFDLPAPAQETGSRSSTDLKKPLLDTIHRGTMSYLYKGVPTVKSPFDLALYSMLLWEVRPRTIIEIGSYVGGSALWLADQVRTFGLQTHIHSVDLNPVSDRADPAVTFRRGDANELSRDLSASFMQSLPRPLLVIEDSSHAKSTTLAVLEFFHQYLLPGEYIIIEDGNVNELGLADQYDGGPCAAIDIFLNKYDDYEIDTRYCDWFGNNVTYAVNGFIRRRAHPGA